MEQAVPIELVAAPFIPPLVVELESSLHQEEELIAHMVETWLTTPNLVPCQQGHVSESCDDIIILPYVVSVDLAIERHNHA